MLCPIYPLDYNIFPPDDLGVKIAIRDLYGLDDLFEKRGEFGDCRTLVTVCIGRPLVLLAQPGFSGKRECDGENVHKMKT